MNKLEKYKLDSSTDFLKKFKNHEHRAGGLVGYDAGFDAVIALDLPVKFAEWKDKKTIEVAATSHSPVKFRILGEDKKFSYKELYQYWETYIYKPE